MIERAACEGGPFCYLTHTRYASHQAASGKIGVAGLRPKLVARAKAQLSALNKLFAKRGRLHAQASA